jgi:hypothetical protein
VVLALGTEQERVILDPTNRIGTAQEALCITISGVDTMTAPSSWTPTRAVFAFPNIAYFLSGSWCLLVVSAASGFPSQAVAADSGTIASRLRLARWRQNFALGWAQIAANRAKPWCLSPQISGSTVHGYVPEIDAVSVILEAHWGIANFSMPLRVLRIDPS